MSDEQKNTIRSVFGKEFDVSTLEGMDLRELLALNSQMLQFEGGDPAFQYGWLNSRDPLTSYKTRKGLWEVVPEDDSVITPGAINADGERRVNEMVAVRMPKERYQKMKLAAVALAVKRDQAAAEVYKGNIKKIARDIEPTSTGAPYVENSEEVRLGRR